MDWIRGFPDRKKYINNKILLVAYEEGCIKGRKEAWRSSGFKSEWCPYNNIDNAKEEAWWDGFDDGRNDLNAG